MFFLSVSCCLLLAAEYDELLGGGNAVGFIFLVEPRGLGSEERVRRIALVLLQILRHGGDALAQLGDDLGIVRPAFLASHKISLFE